MSDKKQPNYYSDYHHGWQHKILEENFKSIEELPASQDDELNDIEALNKAARPGVSFDSLDYLKWKMAPKSKPSNIKVLPRLNGLNADQVEYIIDELNAPNGMIPHKFIMNGKELISKEKYSLTLGKRTFVYYPSQDQYEEIIEE